MDSLSDDEIHGKIARLIKYNWCFRLDWTTVFTPQDQTVYIPVRWNDAYFDFVHYMFDKPTKRHRVTFFNATIAASHKFDLQYLNNFLMDAKQCTWILICILSSFFHGLIMTEMKMLSMFRVSLIKTLKVIVLRKESSNEIVNLQDGNERARELWRRSVIDDLFASWYILVFVAL